MGTAIVTFSFFSFATPVNKVKDKGFSVVELFMPEGQW